MNSNVRNVVMARTVQCNIQRRGIGIGGDPQTRSDAAYINGVALGVEGRAEAVERPATAHINCGGVVWADKPHILGGDQMPKFFDGDGRASGDIGGKLFESE